MYYDVVKETQNYGGAFHSTGVSVGGKSIYCVITYEDQAPPELQGMISMETFANEAVNLHCPRDNFRITIDMKSNQLQFDCRPWRRKLSADNGELLCPFVLAKSNFKMTEPIFKIDARGWCNIDLTSPQEFIVDMAQSLLDKNDPILTAARNGTAFPIKIGGIKLILHPAIRNNQLGVYELGMKFFENKVLILDFRDKLAVIKQ